MTTTDAQTDDVLKEFTCFMCEGLRRPYQLCPEGHTSCLECFEKLLTTKPSCPMCRKPIHAKPHANLLGKNVAEMLGIRSCANVGCHEMFDARVAGCDGGLAAHAGACLHAPVACQWCARRLDRAAAADHATKCVKRPVACANEGCEATFPANEKEAHAAACSRRPAACRWACAGRFTHDQIEAHELICNLRRMNCANDGCRETLVGPAATAAHAGSCPLRTLACPSCEARVRAIDLDVHNMSCPMRIVACVCGCGAGGEGCIARVTASAYADHLRQNHGFTAYHYGFGLDGFEVQGLASEAVDLVGEGVVALRAERLAGGDLRLSVGATPEFAAAHPEGRTRITVLFPNGMALGSGAKPRPELILPVALMGQCPESEMTVQVEWGE